MRCKKHLSDHSSSVGVCASCLRERLLALIVAQSQSQSQYEDRRKQHHHPPPLIFPRSVSPYVCRRKSDDTTWAHTHRFYSTPQVGPTSTTTVKKTRAKFSLISNLFRSRSGKYNSDPRVGCPDSSGPSSPSSLFFSTIFPWRRKQKSTLCFADDSTANDRRACQISNRGMSPAREAESDEDCDPLPWGSGDSTEKWRRTRTTSFGLAFCLSPLVRASPNRQWNQKSGFPPELAYSGEVKPQLSTAASYCANRSRKLADFGRVDHNR